MRVNELSRSMRAQRKMSGVVGMRYGEKLK